MDECITRQWASQVRKYILMNNIAEIKTILDKQPRTKKKKISDCDVYGVNALHKSVQLDRSNIVKYLIEECHADPNSLSDSDQAPLELAGINGNLEMMKYLYQHGADIHVKNRDDQTYLMQFVKNSNICEFLLSEGVDINAKDPYNDRTALSCAVEDYCVRTVELLAKYGVNIDETLHNGDTSVAFACCHGDLDMLEVLLSCGADIYRRGAKGCSYLIQSVDQPEICRFLLSNGVNVNDVDSEKNSKTALCLAAEEKELDTMEILLNHLADVNIADDDGNTALHYAVEVSDLEQLKMLVKHEADLNKRNCIGLMPIHTAALKGLTDIVDYLAKNVQTPTTVIVDAYELLAAEAFKKYKYQDGKHFILEALKLRESIQVVTKSPTIINEIFGKEGKEPEVNRLTHLQAALDKKVKEGDEKKDGYFKRYKAIYKEFEEDMSACLPIDVSTILYDKKITMLIQASLIQARIISPYSEAVLETLEQMISLNDKEAKNYCLEIRRIMIDIAINTSHLNCGEDETCRHGNKVFDLLKSYLLDSLTYDPKTLNFSNIVHYLNKFLDYILHHAPWIQEVWEADLGFSRIEDQFDVIAVFTMYRLFIQCSSKEEEKKVQELVHRLLKLIEKIDKKYNFNIHSIYFGMKFSELFKGLSTPAMLSLLKALVHEGMDIICKNQNEETVLEHLLDDMLEMFNEPDSYDRHWDYWDRLWGSDEHADWKRRHRDDDASKVSELIEFLLNAGISLYGKRRYDSNALERIRKLPKKYREQYYCSRKETSLQCLAAKVIMKAPEETYMKSLPKHLTVFVQIHSGSKCCKN